MKARGGDCSVIRGQHLTEGMAVFTIATGRGKYAAQLGRVLFCHSYSFQADRQGESDNRTTATTLGGWQQSGDWQNSLVGGISLLTRQNDLGARPVSQTRS